MLRWTVKTASMPRCSWASVLLSCGAVVICKHKMLFLAPCLLPFSFPEFLASSRRLRGGGPNNRFFYLGDLSFCFPPHFCPGTGSRPRHRWSFFAYPLAPPR